MAFAISKHSFKSRFPADGSRREGFALVISLSLMALVLLLLVVLSSQLRIHLGASSSDRSEVLAKESARLGFLVALGNLQRAAGPDQRVTARADLFLDEEDEILFADETLPENRFWTGVWDTTRETEYESGSLSPVWLVSGESPLPADPTASNNALILPGYDPTGGSNFAALGAFFPVQVETEAIAGTSAEFAWWVSDEGVKAPVALEDNLIQEVSGLPEDSEYLDYGPFSSRLLRQNHDPNFPYPLLYNFETATNADLAKIERIMSRDDLPFAANGLSAMEERQLLAESLHDVTASNQFVLSNPIDGGLKKDLSFVKTLDLDSLTQVDIETLYGPVAAPLTPQALKLLQVRANPTTTNDIRGERLVFAADSLEDASALPSSFTFAPIITEFQLSCGVAAEDGDLKNATSKPSEVYFVYKIYLDLWNPYSIPMRIGDGAASAEPNSFDIRIEIENLPSGIITNMETSDSVAVSLPKIDFLWSESSGVQPGKNIRPGMNFHTTFPLDSHGEHGTGVFQEPLGVQINGSRSDDYEGQFSMSSPLSIRVTAIANNGDEFELCLAEIENYPDFTISYIYDWSDRSSWFKRVPESVEGFGMNHESLEMVGYAFGYRFRLLDEQESLGNITDLSRLLSETDIRNQVIEVDLNNWSLGEAWEGDSPLPYDFTSSHAEVNPGFFQPSHGFLSSDFYDFALLGSGRKDRVAKIYELPTLELSSVYALRNLRFRDFPTRAIGSPWGGNLNEFFDAFFFSTLPDPSESSWDGVQPLRNPRIKTAETSLTPSLADPESAEGLKLKNGFNLNSSSPRAWTSILTGRSILANSLVYRYERPNESYGNSDPPWNTLDKPLKNIIVSMPETLSFNLIERPEDPRFELHTLFEEGEGYTDSFSMAATELNMDRQHPAFIQGIREMTDADLASLGKEVVRSLKQFAEANNRPPFSMAEFLNAGILQDAIDEVPSINDRLDGYDRIPRYSPANVHQGTLVAKIAEYSQVRSDTFTIRSSGFAAGEATTSGSGFYCEAIVQRKVDEVEPTGGPFGRQFEVVQFRWIPKPTRSL